MSLINCPHCKHKVSEDAIKCPSCNKPVPVLSDRSCNDCGERLPKRKRKCPSCGYDNTNNNSKQKTNKMASNNNNRFLVILVVLGIAAAGFYYVTQEESVLVEEAPKEMVIPNGTYTLTNARRETAALCQLSFLTFGKTITISGKTAYTTAGINELSYDIVNKEENVFQIGPATAPCFYTDNMLTFKCHGENINYLKEK